VMTTAIHFCGSPISSRIWLDNGAQITLIKKSFIEEHRIVPRKSTKQFVLLGLNSSDVSDSFIVDFVIYINDRKIRIPALVSDAPLLSESSEDILLGSDVLSKKIGYIVPCNAQVTWWAKDDESIVLKSMLGQYCASMGRDSTSGAEEVALANLGNDQPLHTHRTEPDNTAVFPMAGIHYAVSANTMLKSALEQSAKKFSTSLKSEESKEELSRELLEK